MRIKTLANLIAGLTLALGLTACGAQTDPCAQLSAPSAASVQAAQEGVEVEAELEDGTECVVDGQTGRYVNAGADD